MFTEKVKLNEKATGIEMKKNYLVNLNEKVTKI